MASPVYCENFCRLFCMKQNFSFLFVIILSNKSNFLDFDGLPFGALFLDLRLLCSLLCFILVCQYKLVI